VDSAICGGRSVTTDDPWYSDAWTPTEGVRASPRRLAQWLQQGGRVSDRLFDRWLRRDSRVVSGTYWTPLDVATRVSQWLHRHNTRSVVDIGSGAGKFCVAAALTCDCEFTGVEHRPHLVETARELALRFDVHHRVRFLEGTFGRDPLPEAEAYYVFNPFRENLERTERQLDNSVCLNESRYATEVQQLTTFLGGAPARTLFIEYGGFGGHVPASYELLHSERHAPCLLRCWRKAEHAQLAPNRVHSYARRG